MAVATYQASGAQCPATPTRDRSQSFAPFDPRERFQAKGGQPGPRGWEWAVGPALGSAGGFVQGDLEWRSGRTYGYRLTYGPDGRALLEVTDGANAVRTLTWSGAPPMRVGNAVRLVLRVDELGPDARAVLTIDAIDGVAIGERLVVRGDEAGDPDVGRRVYAGRSLEDGFTIEGTLRLVFPTGEVPAGRQFDLRVMAGNVQCQGTVTQASAGLYYIHADHLNTPRVVTDSQQRVVWRWENQEPFGNSLPEENPSGLGAFEFPLRFPGQYLDKETGLFYNYFRDYDPQTGRYVQSDPIGLAGGINPYAYGYDDRSASPILKVSTCTCANGRSARSVVPVHGAGPTSSQPSYHQYPCVVIGGTQICGGQTIERAREGDWWPWGAGLALPTTASTRTRVPNATKVCAWITA